ncbi:hypothetical protein BUALT_Bualt10G0001900 [Buddleja alternifolia]|uniref:Uncharacterized protein n=1 Tax=Buddleja alternifolia TaxID=168488 RepID=A0AAV6X248_9LAMI|nr:hypothetical protein BUALT_Bualt10G0001900 [Buddleja alternifolia]
MGGSPSDFDCTTELEAVLFGDIAQTILSLTPMELMKKDEQNEKIDCDAVNARLHGKQFNADIRKKNPNSVRRRRPIYCL